MSVARTSCFISSAIFDFDNYQFAIVLDINAMNMNKVTENVRQIPCDDYLSHCRMWLLEKNVRIGDVMDSIPFLNAHVVVALFAGIR